MTKDIETILITGILELGEKSDKLIESITASFKTAINLILQSNEVFYQIPERIYVSMDRFEKIENDCGSIIGLAKDIETNFGIQNESKIDYFDEEGVILFEGIAAAAFGRMSYIYRSKGIRIYLFKNSIIKVVTPYSTIDHNGFQLHQEESFEMILDDVNNKNIEDVFWFTKKDINNKDELRFYSHEIIRILTEIKKPFNRNYFLEYLLTPPDVDELSNFSINIKNALWDLCLS
ncbi:MAG TPA: hypothetical protein VFC67_21095 [Prolixibacteraceae bacterium]|nr:hypothetical protein [Prolixibacteraceae bacterium]